MNSTLSIKQLRLSLPKVIKELSHGKRFTLIYRSQPVGNLVPISSQKKNTKTLLEFLQSRSHRFKSEKNSALLTQEEREE